MNKKYRQFLKTKKLVIRYVHKRTRLVKQISTFHKKKVFIKYQQSLQDYKLLSLVGGVLSSLLDHLRRVVLFRLSERDKIFFIKRLSFLISSGMPLSESLGMIRDQSNSKHFVLLLNQLVGDISSGQSLSKALERNKDQFGDFAINIVYFGESSGTLSQSLDYLVIELKKRHSLKKKIIGASIYPIIVISAVFAVVGFLIIYLFPKILPVFASLHVQLPLSTRFVIYVSTVVHHYGLLILLFLGISIFGFYWLLRHFDTLRLYTNHIKFHIPVVGNMVKSYNLASATRILGLLLRSGLTLGESLHIASRSVSNELYRIELQRFVGLVNQGDLLSAHLKGKGGLFPEIISGVVAVGERSGNLPESLIYLSELYEEEVDDMTRNISNLIEPILMIIMGLLVGFIAISIISPIYGITTNLHSR